MQKKIKKTTPTTPTTLIFQFFSNCFYNEAIQIQKVNLFQNLKNKNTVYMWFEKKKIKYAHVIH
jgi:hypothetical protein